MEALGSEVHVVSDPDGAGGVSSAPGSITSRALCASDDRYVWLNQYTNQGQLAGAFIAPRHPPSPASSRQLGRVVRRGWHHGDIDGFAHAISSGWHRPVRVVAVDSFGSVIFGGSPGRRMIPGLGMTVRPPLLDESYVDEVVRVEEADSIRACPPPGPGAGFLFGGSTGTVVPAGAMDWLSRHDTSDLTAVGHRARSGASATSTPFIRPTGSKPSTAKDVPEQRFSTFRVQAVQPDRLLIREVVMGSMAGTLTAEPETSSEGVSRRDAGRRDEDRGRYPSTVISSTTWARTRWSWPNSARGCGKREGLPVMSMKDIYANPTIRSLGGGVRDSRGPRPR